MAKSLSYDKDHAEQFLGAAIFAFREALNASVSELAKVKGTDDLSWFDQLRQDSVRAAKGTITEQIPIEVEARALRFGFEVIDAEFESIRLRLVKAE